jgi:hypothetical protein
MLRTAFTPEVAGFRVPSLPLQKCPQIVDPGGRSALRSDNYAPAALVRQAVGLRADAATAAGARRTSDPSRGAGYVPAPRTHIVVMSRDISRRYCPAG